MSIKKAIFTNTIITTITYELTEFGRWDCNALDKAVWKVIIPILKIIMILIIVIFLHLMTYTAGVEPLMLYVVD